MFLYVVACEFDSAEVAQQWVDWLEDEHLAEVCSAGALSAQVVRLDGPAIAYEVHYRFRDRGAFQSYQREQGLRLRAEGLRRFPLKLGLRYARRAGEIIATHAPDAPPPHGML